MNKLPSIFIGHGAPTIVVEESPAHNFLQSLGGLLPKPSAILCASAHWESVAPEVSSTPNPSTMYDFYGFPRELYGMRYPAPGAPQLATQVARLLTAAGLPARLDSTRGLDHGAWIPLRLIYPEADIPVMQISLPSGCNTDYFLALGRVLAPLRREGVLIIGSGNATHNLRAYTQYAENPAAAPPDWVVDFDCWLEEAITAGHVSNLLRYRKLAPHAVENHPSEEHFMPLLVALGAGGGAGRLLHRSFSYGVLSMAAYAFE